MKEQATDDKDSICCAPTWDKPKLRFVNSHHLSNEAVSNPLNDFHSLLCQFKSSKVASVQSITISLVKAIDREALLPVSWDLPISNVAMARLQIMVAHVSPAALIISTSTPDGPAALPDFILVTGLVVL